MDHAPIGHAHIVTHKAIHKDYARKVSSRHNTGSRKAEGQKNQQAEYTHIPILPSECGYTRECADGIEGVCFDELMADSDDLLMCTPGESGQVVIIKTPSFYCQGPCVSHPRKQMVEGRSVSRQRPENEDREDAEQALWLRDRHRTLLDAWLPFCLMF